MLLDENYTTAEAFILTFSLNNYPRDDPKFKVVQEWESRFLDIVQEYQKNNSTNFTFAYMAEVSFEILYLLYKFISCIHDLGPEPKFGHYISLKMEKASQYTVHFDFIPNS